MISMCLIFGCSHGNEGTPTQSSKIFTCLILIFMLFLVIMCNEYVFVQLIFFFISMLS